MRYTPREAAPVKKHPLYFPRPARPARFHSRVVPRLFPLDFAVVLSVWRLFILREICALLEANHVRSRSVRQIVPLLLPPRCAKRNLLSARWAERLRENDGISRHQPHFCLEANKFQTEQFWSHVPGVRRSLKLHAEVAEARRRMWADWMCTRPECAAILWREASPIASKC